jgi:hypothetical protein
MAEEGLVAPLARHVEVRINGGFAGLYGLVEDVDNELLEVRVLTAFDRV